jgi:hypothetical protein
MPPAAQAAGCPRTVRSAGGMTAVLPFCRAERADSPASRQRKRLYGRKHAQNQAARRPVIEDSQHCLQSGPGRPSSRGARSHVYTPAVLSANIRSCHIVGAASLLRAVWRPDNCWRLSLALATLFTLVTRQGRTAMYRDHDAEASF